MYVMLSSLSCLISVLLSLFSVKFVNFLLSGLVKIILLVGGKLFFMMFFIFWVLLVFGGGGIEKFLDDLLCCGLLFWFL